MVAVIRIIEERGGEEEVVVLELTEDVVSIGRAVENHVRIDDPLASRIHCQIEREEESYKLVDLESQNGTQVNDRKVNVKVLEEGDRITIGEVVIIFEMEEEASKPRLKPLRRRRSRRRPKVRRQKVKPTAAERLAALDEKLAGVLEEIGRSLGSEGLVEAESIFQDYLDRGEGRRF
ncbi:MAG: FHA domain-containing protein, partial [Planctomycetota bacterium]